MSSSQVTCFDDMVLKTDAKIYDEMIFDVNTEYIEEHGGYDFAKKFYKSAFHFAEHEIYSRFNSFVENKTAIYISHRLSSCAFCNNIAVFDKAELVETGAHQQLVEKNGKYRELWNAQAKYYMN